MRTPRCRRGGFPLIPPAKCYQNGYPIATESVLQSPVCRLQPRCFPPQSVRFFSLFCKTGFSGRSRSPSRPGQRRVDPTFTSFTQGRLRLHTALRTQRRDAPHCRFIICFVHGSAYHNGSTSTHKNRSPRKQGRGIHAIGNRPESASAKSALPPSIHPRLGVSSRHQKFHRCAL